MLDRMFLTFRDVEHSLAFYKAALKPLHIEFLLPYIRLVADPGLSPLDLAIAPSGIIVVSIERRFGAEDAVTTVREYDARDGRLVRVFFPDGKAAFLSPRGLRFSPDGRLYCVGHDEVVAFDFTTGQCLGAVAQLLRLNGQAPVFFPE